MDILIIMTLGLLFGIFLFPRKKITIEGLKIFQLICTLILIFSMGALLGKKENFLNDLVNLGWTSFLLFLFPTLFSTIFVYFLTKKFMLKKKEREK
ncbi:MAG: hypothetical protein SO253_01695 [Bacilli bacterium]|nr:hypothetical protein [Bacilli bacterium]